MNKYRVLCKVTTSSNDVLETEFDIDSNVSKSKIFQDIEFHNFAKQQFNLGFDATAIDICVVKVTDMVEITVKTDDSCEMASVYDSCDYGMTGNYWDFHNDCHGMYDLPEFNGVEDFIYELSQKHIKQGRVVVVNRVETEFNV